MDAKFILVTEIEHLINLSKSFGKMVVKNTRFLVEFKWAMYYFQLQFYLNFK
jgi:hypothetical protein